MSYAYAQANKISPLRASAREIIVATAEPYLHEWEKELSRLLRAPIRRVVANPLDIPRAISSSSTPSRGR